jgi:PKD repeat protein
MNSLAAYVNSIDGIYVGSDAGVYYRDASMTDWEMFSNGLPVDASVNEIEIYHNPDNPADDVIRAGTYGRGLWSSPVWHGQPVADFEADETTVPMGCEVNFTDLSLGVPTSWEWTFEGGTPSTSTARNPEGIVFDEEGEFAVTLTVSNEEGTDSKTIEDYITASAAALPNVAFMANDSAVCSGTVVTFTDMSTNCPSGWEWSFEPPTAFFVNGTNMNSQSPQVAFGDNTSYTVSLAVTNGAGSNTLTKDDYIHIGGMQLPFADDFEMGSLAAMSWSVENPDFNKTWGMATVGGNSPGDQAAFMNLFEYLVPPGPRDRLISPPLTFEGFDEVYLSFQHAYAKQHPTVTDSLIVKISDDCGESWTRIFEGGEDNTGSFATHEPMTDPFTPAMAEDWCGNGWGAPCNVINISQWAGKDNVRIMFETYSYFGNNLYIDNVLVGPMTAVGENEAHEEVRIYPNPTSGMVNILLPEQKMGFSVSIYSSQGAELITFDERQGGTLTADLGRYGRGIYFIRILQSGKTSVSKVVLE